MNVSSKVNRIALLAVGSIIGCLSACDAAVRTEPLPRDYNDIAQGLQLGRMPSSFKIEKVRIAGPDLQGQPQSLYVATISKEDWAQLRRKCVLDVVDSTLKWTRQASTARNYIDIYFHVDLDHLPHVYASPAPPPNGDIPDLYIGVDDRSTSGVVRLYFATR